MSYFEKEAWPCDWKDAAQDVVRNLWNERYKPAADATSQPTPPEPEVNAKDQFAKKKKVAASTSGDALEDWLASLPVDADAAEKPLRWWVEDYPKVRHWSPELQRMALDILSCPATSADVEHFFSRGGLMVTKCRYALSDELGN
ncbi:hypothetical protein MPER_05596 [Moniliophthora perniciosa FA553]|nr:hypothetical protein MPER_05596 [Moniliophthora perniciosa FA553]